MQGTVVKSTGSWYQVKKKDGEVIDCRIKGKFRLGNFALTNPVAVGDIVSFEMEGQEGQGIITEIQNRKNYILRQSPRKKHEVHIIASNVDQALLIITIVQPKLKQGFIDRFLLMTEPHDIPAIIAFNKSDIYSEKDHVIYDILAEIYTKIGYDVINTSSVTNEGIAELKQKLTNKTTLVAGQSGVGKSSLVNTIEGSLDLKTTDLSDYTGKGQHTTTFAEMHPLNFGGSIIDTPGIKSLSFNNLEVMDVAHNFREFFLASADCKFANCTHRNEPKCNVKHSIEEGNISELRYLNYLQILEEIEDQNYWELKTDY